MVIPPIADVTYLYSGPSCESIFSLCHLTKCSVYVTSIPLIQPDYTTCVALSILSSKFTQSVPLVACVWGRSGVLVKFDRVLKGWALVWLIFDALPVGHI